MTGRAIDREQRAQLVEAELILRQAARRLAELAETAERAGDVTVLVKLAEDTLERGLAALRESREAVEAASEAPFRARESGRRE